MIRYAASIMAFKNLKPNGVFEAEHKLYVFSTNEVENETLVYNAIFNKAKTEFFSEDEGYFHWDVQMTRVDKR